MEIEFHIDSNSSGNSVVQDLFLFPMVALAEFGKKGDLTYRVIIRTGQGATEKRGRVCGGSLVFNRKGRTWDRKVIDVEMGLVAGGPPGPW